MSEHFDAYHRWLGIPPKDQPPNHYRLLGLELFEADADVIEEAADRQMSHVRKHQNGQRATLSQSLLNEIAAAKVCLLKPNEKTGYDTQLRSAEVAPPAAVISAVAAQAPPTAAPPRSQQTPGSQQLSPGPSIDVARPVASRRPDTRRTTPVWQYPMIAGACAVGLLIIGALVIAFSGSSVDTARDERPIALAGIKQIAGDQQPTAVENTADADNSQDVIRDEKPEDSDFPEPGAELGRSPVEADAPDTPAGVAPQLIAKARAALLIENIPEMIVRLEQYLADNPQPPWEEEARLLLREGKLVISRDYAKTLLRESFDKMSDDDIRRYAKTKVIPYNVPTDVTDPTLTKLLAAKIRQNMPTAFRERFNRIGSRRTVDQETAPENPFSRVEDKKSIPVARTSDPAEYLANNNLTRVGSRWIIAEEFRLKEQLTVLKNLESRYKKTRDSISENELALFREMRKKLDVDQTVMKKYLESFGGRKVSKEAFRKYKQFDAQLKQLKYKVKVADSKVAERDSALNMIRKDWEQLASTLEESIQAVNNSYARLEEDKHVVAAIDKLGGTLGPTALVRRAETALLSARNTFGA